MRLLLLPFLLLLFSCSDKRTGLPENERNYTKLPDEAGCLSWGGLCVFSSLDLDSIANAIEAENEKILGKDLFTTAVKRALYDSLTQGLFGMRKALETSSFLIDSVEMETRPDPLNYYSSDSIHPLLLNWKKLAVDSNPMIFLKVGDYTLGYNIRLCTHQLTPLGKFKNIRKKPWVPAYVKTETFHDQRNGYQCAMKLVIDFTLYNKSGLLEGGKAEYYRIMLNDTATLYSTAQLDK